MGRTKRKRKNKKQPVNVGLGNEQSSINLRRWLKQNSFTDPLNLQLRDFPGTGRGVTSKQSVRALDVLVKVPFHLLVTFDTIRKSDLIHYLDLEKSLTIQTLLALFLVMEKHKKGKSKWNRYIESLPYPQPLLLWMCNSEDMTSYPDDLRMNALKLQQNFDESWEGACNSIIPVSCKCCGDPLDFLLNFSLFKWAYVLVNTRAVYIDPDYLMSTDNSYASLVADDPSLALCPYMDLINHHHLARTKASVVHVGEKTFYQLTTMTGFKKYEQFFISYGAHSNEKLLMEYGFFIPENIFDTVNIAFKEILTILKLTLDERQYKFIKQYEFSEDELYINQNGVSFILKSILFVGSYPNILNYGSFIFSNRYPSDFDSVVKESTKSMLIVKLESYKSDLRRHIDSGSTNSEAAKLVQDFTEYRVKYVQKLLSLLDENKLCFT